MEMPNDKLMHDLQAVVTDAEASLHLARDRLRKAGGQLDEQVRQHPWTALGIAAGAALVLGILLGRK